jgi:NADH dehydrogenase/NADH:ubiquinone oxidoreductase subunit G
MSDVTLEIDGKSITVKPETTLLQAAKQLGIEIPTLCYHEQLEPAGVCRFCMVEVTKNNRTKLVASCCYPAEEGLKVTTESEKINKIRKVLLELILPLAPTGTHHTLAEKYHADPNRYPLDEEPTYCTLCGLCVRYCNEVKKYNVVGFSGRGKERTITMPEESDLCLFCRKCYSLCEAGKFPSFAGEL